MSHNTPEANEAFRAAWDETNRRWKQGASMGTVTKKIADEIIAGKYKEDGMPTKIVKYTNMFDGGDSYGVVYDDDDQDKYHASPSVINPSDYWTRS
jgi:hypothetical protein